MAQQQHAQQQQQQQQQQGYNQTPEFFLSNYRLGKTLGIGSFGKVLYPRAWSGATPQSAAKFIGVLQLSRAQPPSFG